MTAPVRITAAASATTAIAARSDLSPMEWTAPRATEALAALAKAAGLAYHPATRWPTRATAGPSTAAPPDVGETRSDILESAAERWADGSGLELETRDIPADSALDSVRRLSPALIRIKGRDGLLAVLRVGRAHATLIGPDGATDVSAARLDDALCAALADPAARLATVLGQDGTIPATRRLRVARLLMAPTLAGRPVAEAWRVRASAAGLKEGLRAAKLGWRAGGLVLGYLAQFALFFAVWRQIATRGFAGAGPTLNAVDPGWFWFLTFLMSWVIVEVAVSAGVSRLALDVGAVVRGTLLRGALRLDPERLRTAGVGQLLGRALDAEALDGLALGGGVEALAGVFELALGGMILAWGAAPLESLVALGVVVLAAGALSLAHARRLGTWGRTRRALTHDLVERMIGHRTVLIQDRADARASADDAALAEYDAHTAALDRAEVLLAAAIPRAWLLMGLLILAPVLLSVGGRAGALLAVSVGGVWLVYGAFRRLGRAWPLLALAREGWNQIAPLVGPAPAAAFPAADIHGDIAAAARTGVGDPDSPPLLVADKIAYRYQGRASAVLNDVSLAIAVGDRVLLQGPSGGGKSTLASVLTGLRLPTSGQLRLRGVGQSALGLSRWRGAIGGAPQFHDNHVIGADLLFNLLMGRRWPPRLQDLADAEQVCRDLGLGALLDRMPAGLQQQVGETGWQLSHGERSRLFIARSLLQALDLRVLDESFAALDPETLDQVMDAVLARPDALIVIAHP